MKTASRKKEKSYLLMYFQDYLFSPHSSLALLSPSTYLFENLLNNFLAIARAENVSEKVQFSLFYSDRTSSKIYIYVAHASWNFMSEIKLGILFLRFSNKIEMSYHSQKRKKFICAEEKGEN